MGSVWYATDLEGVLARHVARASLARAVADQDRAMGWVNTDDRMLVEFGFARTVGMRRAFSLVDAYLTARARGEHRPHLIRGQVDWERVDDNYFLMHTMDRQDVPEAAGWTPDQQRRIRACNRFLAADHAGVIEEWSQQSRPPRYRFELMMLSEALAEAGDDGCLPLIESLSVLSPVDADTVLARYHFRNGQAGAAVQALEQALVRLRTDPWAEMLVIERGLGLAGEIAEARPDLRARLCELLEAPFSVRILNAARLDALLQIAKELGPRRAAPVVRQFEPNVPWRAAFLAYRADCYRQVNDPLAEQAERQLVEFFEHEPLEFAHSLR
jgi:hypothetical protein